MAKSFIKKVERTRDTAEHKPIYHDKHKVVFVNPSKFKRAEVIVDLVSGKRVPRTNEEIERKDKFTRVLQEQEIDLKKDDAVPAVYELLGGLIRTPEEQKKADIFAEEARKKGKKKMIE